MHDGLRAVVVGLAALIALAAPAEAAAHNYAAVVVDANTGETLFSRNEEAPRYPASLTKVMTLFVVFEELEAGRLTLNSPLEVSMYAASRPPTRLGLQEGSTIEVEDAILALVTRSANDVATVVAENISGSEAAFARRMTETAHALGMTGTTFRNPNGLPNSEQVTTALDMVTLGRAVQDRFPQYYRYFSTLSFTYDGANIGTHNGLLGDRGVDGIKTGYTNASGFNILISIRRDDRFVVAVVMGGNTAASRNGHMRELLATYVPQATAGERTAPLLAQGPPPPLPLPHPTRVAQISVAGTAGEDDNGGSAWPYEIVASRRVTQCDDSCDTRSEEEVMAAERASGIESTAVLAEPQFGCSESRTPESPFAPFC